MNGSTTPSVTISAAGLIGIGTTAQLATLDVRGASGTLPIASVSGQTAMAGMLVDHNYLGDLFTASKSGATKFVITNAGNVGYWDNITNKYGRAGTLYI